MNWFKTATIVAMIFFFVLHAQSCEAASWTKIGQARDGEIIVGYIDKESIQAISSFFTSMDKFEIWEKWSFSPPRLINNKAVPEILHFTQYRNNKQYCVKEIWYVYADGSRMKNTFSCEYQRVPPDSINELVWNYIFKTYVPTLQ
jgi:hypothetical protein